jgi:gamma-glutamyl phosphate reductase
VIGALVLLVLLVFAAIGIYAYVTRQIAQAIRKPSVADAIQKATQQTLEQNARDASAAEQEVMNADTSDLLRLARKRLWPDN